MATATQLVAAARSERNYTESPAGSNCTKFAAEAGHKNCTFWCATYTTAILKRCAVPIPPGAGTASTRANLAAWKKAGRWVQPADIRPGDVVFYHLTGRNGPGQPDHTGFCVEAPAMGRLLAVEGNTSSSDYGSQDNGGGVYERSRRLAVVLGAGRPAYELAPPPISQSEPEDQDMLVVFADKTEKDKSQVMALDGRLYVIDEGDTAAGIAAAGHKTIKIGPVDYGQLKQKAEQ